MTFARYLDGRGHCGADSIVGGLCLNREWTLPFAVIDANFLFVYLPQFLFFIEGHFPRDFLGFGWAVDHRKGRVAMVRRKGGKRRIACCDLRG
jgi:hypothetical protein